MSFELRHGCVVPLLALAACGGGGGGESNGTPRAGGSGSYTSGVFQPSASFANQCSSITAQNNFLRSWTNELYLWYREVPDQNPANFSATDTYFDILKTPQTTGSGRDKDRFHFTYDTDDWIALSQSGIEAGYGAQWAVLSGTPPRRIVVAYTEPGSPAAAGAVNLTRGAEVLTVDGVDAVNGNTQAAVDTLNAGLFPDAVGQAHTFTIRELSGGTRSVTMTSANVTSTPVPNVSTISTPSGPVGYLLFNDHIATSEAALVNAINTLDAANITDLILDVRYNGGGYLDIAGALGYMISGALTVGQTFETLRFNDKHPATNPITGRPLEPTPFHTRGNFGSSNGLALPTLNLSRVYVITGRGTCSASESIINGLSGVGVSVFQIGSTTCGKPYGFYPKDNCGTTYFSIQFQGFNAANFGDYGDGFAPNNTSGAGGARLTGCSVADDFTRGLGNASEARLAAALAFRAGNNQASACPAATGFAPGVLTKPGQPLSIADGMIFKSPWRENRMLREL